MHSCSVEREAASLFRTLVVCGQEKQKEMLAHTLLNHGITLYETGRLEDALTIQRETISLLRALVVHGEEEQKERLAVALLIHGGTLFEMGSLEDALIVQRENVSLFRALVTHGEEQKVNLARALLNYGNTLLRWDILKTHSVFNGKMSLSFVPLLLIGRSKRRTFHLLS